MNKEVENVWLNKKVSFEYYKFGWLVYINDQFEKSLGFTKSMYESRLILSSYLYSHDLYF